MLIDLFDPTTNQSFHLNVNHIIGFRDYKPNPTEAKDFKLLARCCKIITTGNIHFICTGTAEQVKESINKILFIEVR